MAKKARAEPGGARTGPPPTQTAYAQGHITDGVSLDQAIRSAMYHYLRDDLGLPESVARDRAEAEIMGKIGTSVCDQVENDGISLRGKTVLDLGAGLGGLSAEIARRGANVFAVEPGAAWRSLAAKRLIANGRGTVVGAAGEHLPFADNSIDLILSLQVLEHVQDPRQVIREAFRVLKPGGYLSITYENYLSFWEPHYRVRWFPLLPKPLGVAYLKMLGRDPRFLTEAITYTTFPRVRRHFAEVGFSCVRQDKYRQALEAPHKTGVKWKILKILQKAHSGLALRLLVTADYGRRMFRTNVHEMMQKSREPATQ